MIQLLKILRANLRKTRTRLLRRAGKLKGDWQTGLSDEARFWADALRDGGRHWNLADYQERMNPDLPLQDYLRELIAAPPGATVRILDVGAGPLTRVGRRWEDRSIEIVPVDPLADEYREIFRRLGLQPPIVTIAGQGEKLLEQFPADSFDLAYASNALDHSYDPLEAIRQMVAVVKPGGWAYLWHFAEAGVHEAYQGLHQWNFVQRKGDMIVSDGRHSHSLQEHLGSTGEVRASEEWGYNSRVVVARIRKAGGALNESRESLKK